MIRRLLPLIVFLALACVLLWPVLFGGRVLMPGGMIQAMSPWSATQARDADDSWNALLWDSAAYFYPARDFLGRSLRSGTLPLWNPYQMCGTPFLANFQSALLYPPNWLFALIPTARAIGWLAFLHLFLAGAFTYLFLRGIGIGRIGSTFGGVAFMLSGFAVTWLELPVFLSTAIWLPLALHYSRMAHETGSARHTVVAGIAIALSLLGGHPQIAFYCLLAVGLYWIYLGVSGRRTTSLFRSIVLAGFTFGLGLMLAAPQIYPALELAELSHRGGALPTSEGYAAYSGLALPWQHLVTLLMPYFLVNSWKIPTEFAERCGYIGILPLLLIAAAFARSKERRHAWFMGGLAALGLLMALGTGINRLFYFGVPGFAHSGSPSRALFLFMFSVAVLGGMGLDYMLSGDRKRGPSVLWIAAPAGVILALGAVLTHINLATVAGEYSEGQLLSAEMPRIVIFVVYLAAGVGAFILTLKGKISRDAGGALAVVVLAADLLTFGIGFNPTCKPSEVYCKTQTTDLLKAKSGYSRIMPLNDKWSLMKTPRAVLPPNAATAYGLYDVQGYDALYPVRYKALLDAAAGCDSCPRENGNMVFARNPQSPVYDLLGVQWVISQKPVPGARNAGDGCYVYRNRGVLPRAFLAQMIEYGDDQDILQRIASGEANLRSVALVDADDADQINPWPVIGARKSGKPAESDSVTIRRYGCNRVLLDVQATAPSVLVLTDQYYPGWRARVDGKLASVAQVDYDFRGIAVPAGTHSVEFIYRPESFDKGLRLMEIAFVIIAGFLIYMAVRFLESRRVRA